MGGNNLLNRWQWISRIIPKTTGRMINFIDVTRVVFKSHVRQLLAYLKSVGLIFNDCVEFLLTNFKYHFGAFEIINTRTRYSTNVEYFIFYICL